MITWLSRGVGGLLQTDHPGLPRLQSDPEPRDALLTGKWGGDLRSVAAEIDVGLGPFPVGLGGGCWSQ